MQMQMHAEQAMRDRHGPERYGAESVKQANPLNGHRRSAAVPLDPLFVVGRRSDVEFLRSLGFACVDLAGFRSSLW